MRYYSFIPSGGTVFSILLFLINEASMYAQTNLVLNPSFEEYYMCPPINNVYKIENAKNWHNPTFSSNLPPTPDYFNECYSIPTNNVLGVPINSAGYQFARTGLSYAGVYTYTAVENVREYIMGKLIIPLALDSTYYVEFYVNKADRASVSVDKISLYFSVDSLSINSNLALNLVPHVNNSNGIIRDTIYWTKISGLYKASGDEKWIIIGNFNTDSTTDIIYNDSGYIASYYYIDDVTVYKCTYTNLCLTIEDTVSDTPYVHIPNIFTPNADGTNDAWQVRATGVQQLSAAVYNRWGALLWQQSITDTGKAEIKTAWNGYTSTGLPVSAGTYYYLVSYTTKEGETKKEKGFLTLVR